MSITIYIAAAYVCSLLAALALTPVIVQIARRWGLVDLPGARKVHQVPTPRIGGIAVAIAMLGTIIPVFLAVVWGTDAIGGDKGRVATMLLAGGFVLLVGLIDDICNIPASYKLGALVIAAIAFGSSGGLIREFNLTGSYAIPLGMMAWPVTIIWVVAVTASVNFIDGLDGLAAGIVAIACGVVAVGAAVTWQVPVLIASLAMLGSLTGFLFYNFNPAKVFMGDCGSMFIGFMLAACGVLYTVGGTSAGGLLLPALALSIPFLDLLLTVVRRNVLQRRSLFAAERGHIHHRLLDIGLRHTHAVLVLYAATLAASAVALMCLFKTQWIFVSAVVLLVPCLLTLFRVAGSVRGRETLAAVRRNRALSREGRANHRALEEMQLRFRNVTSFGQWWEELCAAAEMMGLVNVVLPLENRDGTVRVLRWCRTDAAYLECETLKAGLPVKNRRAGATVTAEIEVAVLTSLESAGQRVAMFSRLMGEHSLAEIDARSAAQRGRQQLTKESERARQFKREQRREAKLKENASDKQPRIAIVHDFLYTYAGAERVIEQMLKIYPGADMFSLFDFLPPGQREFIQGKPVTTSFIQRLPFARSRHRAYLPLMPLAIEQLDVSAYDIVISSSYCVAKGVLTRPDQLHICYCHSPMRFAWDLHHQYLAESGLVRGIKSMAARIILHYARTWDARSANGVDLFVTNSDFVGRRIEKVYRRQSLTIYPPVDIGTFSIGSEQGGFYVTASRMVPYKRMDLIVEAFTAMPERTLIVIGDGPDMEKIRSKAGPNVKLVGHQPVEELRRYLQLAKAFIFAAEEDFGIVAVEAQACGTPVIAYSRGGAAETILPGVTGEFFDEQTVDSLADAVEEFETKKVWDKDRIRQNAERFSTGRFRGEFENLVNNQWERFKLTRSQQHRADVADEKVPATWPSSLGVEDAGELPNSSEPLPA
jgi:UDP-N-acetylmuramyl pentapeptide phosphotransferase/UDP-N-acetylglucosamine-1-phosphate transferase/glycosyltransferase involved in cell wall biosynthesis